MRFYFSFLAFLITGFIFFINAYNDNTSQIIENWNRLSIDYQMRVSMQADQMQRRRAVVREKARELIIRQAASHLENLIVDEQYKIRDFLKNYQSFSEEYSVFLMNLDMASFYFQGNFIHTGLRIAIRGKEGLLRTLPLPWNTESYGSLQKNDVNQRYYESSYYFPLDREAVAPEYYDSLVIDATGIDLVPAIAPRIYTDFGRLVYGPEFLKKRFAVERGIVTYIKDFKKAREKSRQGKNPFVSVALASRGKYKTDVVISEKDSSIFFSQESNIRNLLKCRVIFLIKK